MRTRDEVQVGGGGVEGVERGVLAYEKGSKERDVRPERQEGKSVAPRNMISASGPVPILTKKVSSSPSLVAISL